MALEVMMPKEIVLVMEEMALEMMVPLEIVLEMEEMALDQGPHQLF